jgi:hypothetical protein
VKKLSAAEVTAKWNTRANAASGDWATGIQAVTVNPGQAAAAVADVWQANTIAGRAKWQAKLGSMNLADWKNQTTTKGQARYGPGITAGQTKYATAIAKILQVEASIVGSLPPRGNRSQNIQRSAAFQEAMGAAADQGQFS